MPKLTLEEQENILLAAQGLLREPASWVKRKWKCPAYARDPKDRRRLLRDEAGNRVPATDANGAPLYQYCIHGAVEQAALDVLTPSRLEEFRIRRIDDQRIAFNDGAHSTLADALGLDAIARELYDMDAMRYNDARGSKREGVLTILRTGLERVREKINPLGT